MRFEAPTLRGTAAAALLSLCNWQSLPAAAQGAPVLKLRNTPPQVVFNAERDRCAPIDTPDVPPRAYRDASGAVNMFALHFVNRALRGPDLASVKIDCSVALNSSLDAEPSHYDDRRYITATWTTDGKTVSAVVHHEYHADHHKRCSVSSSLGCWYNSLVAFRSQDGGQTFSLSKPAVVASAPFRANIEEGRHRGFFNPSNIVSDGSFEYFLSATTGWAGQPYGVCLFRSSDPSNSALWRAWDGTGFTVQYRNPYGPDFVAPKPCKIIEPFLFPVGGIVRHRTSRQWIAVWSTKGGAGVFPVSGIYYATSADLKTWSAPHLLRMTPSLLDGTCEGTVISYPTLIDETASGRNFDDAGNEAWLYYAQIEMHQCQSGKRLLLREKVSLESGRKEPAR